MAEEFNVWLALSGWLAWLAKEIISKLLGRQLERGGPRGVINEEGRIVCDTNSRNAGVVTVDYFPEMAKHPQYADCRRFRARIQCQLFNDTDTDAVYSDMKVELWGVEGSRITCNDPATQIYNDTREQWLDTRAVTVPAHGVVRVRFELFIGTSLADAEDDIRELYDGAVALLRYSAIDGKQWELRVCRSSLAGIDRVVWPDECKYPVYNKVDLNADGRRAGRKPQKRRDAA